MAKSLFEVEVKDEAFKRFLELFEQYRTELKDTGADWEVQDGAIAAIIGGLQQMTAALVAQRRLEREQDEARRKQKEDEKQLYDLEKKRRDEIHKMYQDSLGIAKTVTGVTLDLFKWVGIGGILSGLIGAGGLWGLDRLAESATDQRKAALGYGISTAQKSALDIDYGKYVDVDPALESIASAKAQPGGGGWFARLGIKDWQNKDAAELLVEITRRGRELYKQTGGSQPLLDAYGATHFISMDRLRGLAGVKDDELYGRHGIESQYRQDVGDLQRSDDSSRAMQDFARQARRAGAEIENAFIILLTPVVGELKDLSKEITKFITDFAASHDMKALIQDVVLGLENFVSYLASKEFKDDVTTFMSDFHQLMTWLHDTLETLGIIKETPQEKANRPWRADDGAVKNLLDTNYNLQDAYKTAAAAEDHLAKHPVTWDQIQDAAKNSDPSLSRAASALAYFMRKGWTASQAAGIVGNLGAESGLQAHGPAGDHGTAFGVEQWHQDRINVFEAWAKANKRADFAHSDLNEQYDFVDWELRNKFTKVAEELKTIHKASEAGALVSEGLVRPSGGLVEAGRRGILSANVLVQISNKTGADVATQTKAQVP